MTSKIDAEKNNESPIYVSEKDRLRKPGANRRNLATKLAHTVAQLGEYGLLKLKDGRPPITAYRTKEHY